jgi:hypothetical protein
MHLGGRCVIARHRCSGPRMSDFCFPPPITRSLSIVALAFACGCAGGAKKAEWPPTAKKWFDRANHSYLHGDMEDAKLASDNALTQLPHEPKVRIIAAKIAMAELSFDRALSVLQKLPGSEAAGLRGRAHWYLGDLERAADELAVLVQDPDVKDAWADQTLKLARSGRGRTPFEMSGGLLAAVEMPAAGTKMLVPLELNGEPSLAMIATDRSESVIDSKVAQEGGWVSLRFNGQVEVSDVPAIGQDLSGLSREIGAPIKLLIGVNLLRHLRATVDVAGRQFVVRNYEPSPPPEATTIHPIYYRGGALVLPGAFGIDQSAPSSTLLVNTSMAFPLALDEAGWKKGGKDVTQFVAVPGGGELRHGTLPMLRLGAFEIENVPGVFGAPVASVEEQVGVDLDGFAGSGLLATFRMTFADGGRTLWMEDLPREVIEMRRELTQPMVRPSEVPTPMADPLEAPREAAPATSPAGSSPPPKKALP